jgi:6-phosphofructokinase 1
MGRLAHIGVLTGGGDCPGMNAAVRAVVRAAGGHGIRVTGFLDGFAGLTEDRARPLATADVADILPDGGTILGATNRHDPFRVATPEGAGHVDRSADLLAVLARRGIDGLVVVGGDGSLRIAGRLAALGVNLVGLPKTIDNDVAETDACVGFDSARAIATEAVDRLRTTAASHHRALIVEVMGRHAGWLALEAGLAGGADVILLPEIPWGYEPVARVVRERAVHGPGFALVVVAEGARRPEGGAVVRQRVEDSPEPERLGGIGDVLCHRLQALVQSEVRHVALGHVQRGGPPTALDRVLATRLGAAAVQAARDGAWGAMVALHRDRMARVPIVDAVAHPRLVPTAGDRVTAAREIGITFGDGVPAAEVP